MSLFFAVRQLLVNLPRPCKQALAVALDGTILLAAFHVALWLRFELFFFNTYYLWLSVLACVGGIAALAAFGLYRYVLRYMSERVVFAVIGGVLVSVMLITASNTFLRPAAGLSRAVLAIYALLAVTGLLLVRLAARRLLFPGMQGISDARIPVIIYGAGGAGSQLAMALRASPHYCPCALIDDDPRKHKLMVAGLRIHPPDELGRLIDKYEVQQLLIAMPSAPRARIREIVEATQPYRLRIRLVPSLRELVDSSNRLRLRDLRVEDLLARDPVAPIPELLGRCVADKVVMVTGAGGSIGSELCRQILDLGPAKLVLFDISEPALYGIQQELLRSHPGGTPPLVAILGSVRDDDACRSAIRDHGVQTIYHAAAYKHVPIVESNVAQGILTNTFGTLRLAQAAIATGVRDFVLVSTDKAVRPTNIMGASKRLAELVLQAHAKTQSTTRFSMVRFGNVLGSSGSVVPLFHRQIMDGGPITLTHPEITRYFMTIPEAAQLVLQAGSMGESGSVFVLDMGEPVRIHDLALRMIRLYGLTERSETQPAGDIEIRIVGLRPGEKLYEELLIGDESQATDHPRIMKAQECHLSYDELMPGLDALYRNLCFGELARMTDVLRRLVPEYQPAPHQDAPAAPRPCSASRT